MHIIHSLLLLIIAIILIIGAYQVYFFPQNHPIKKSIRYKTRFDDWIPFIPHFIWVYSFIYYPFIILVVLFIDSFQDFIYISSSFIILVIFHVICFFLYPVKTPIEWRNYDNQKNLSTRFLYLVQGYDKESNCFPSMHVAIATLAASHLSNLASEYSYFFYIAPLLITISCVTTKQHYIIDTIGGAITGKTAFFIYGVFTGL